MLIELDFEAIDAITVASLSDTYRTAYWCLLEDRKRYEADMTREYIVEDMNANKKLMEDIREIMDYYGAGYKLVEIEKEVLEKEKEDLKQADIRKYEMMLKNMR